MQFGQFMENRLNTQQQQLNQSTAVLNRAAPNATTGFPLFFDTMTSNPSKNYIVNHTRFGSNKQKMHH